MKFFTYFLLLVAFPTIGQDLPGQLSSRVRPSFVGLFVHDIQTMKEWYETKLGFKTIQYKTVSDQMGFAMMEWNGIWMEMIQNPKTVSKNSFQSSFPGSKDVEGFFKLGFEAENLDALEQEFKAKGIPFKYQMMTNDNFGMRLFIIEDPEGNWIQFYNRKKDKLEISGYSFWAVLVPDVFKTSAWYERVFQLKLLKEIKDENKVVRVRILSNENFIIEILSTNGTQVADMNTTHILKAGFYVNDIKLAETYFKQKEVKIKHGIFTDEETQMKSFIFEDMNKVMIQVIERLP